MRVHLCVIQFTVISFLCRHILINWYTHFVLCELYGYFQSEQLMRSASVDRVIGNFRRVTFDSLRVLTRNIAFFGDVMPCRAVNCFPSCYKWQDAQVWYVWLFSFCLWTSEVAFLHGVTWKAWLWNVSGTDMCCTDNRVVFRAWYFGVVEVGFKNISPKLSAVFSDLYILVNEKLFNMQSVTVHHT